MRIYGHLPKHTESPRRFRTATDGGDTKQEHVFCEKNVSLNNVHGRTLFNSLFSKELEGKRLRVEYGKKDKNGYSIFGGGVFDFCCSGR